MKITDVRVFELVGAERSGLALYEIARERFAPGQASPHRYIFTEIETDEGITGLSYGGNADVKAVGQLLIGEDPMHSISIQTFMSRWMDISIHRLAWALDTRWITRRFSSGTICRRVRPSVGC